MGRKQESKGFKSMDDSLRASQEGLKIVKDAGRKKGWKRTVTQEWWVRANTSQATLKRFWRGYAIDGSAFRGICAAVEIDWRQVAELSESVELPTADTLREDSTMTKLVTPAIVNSNLVFELGQDDNVSSNWTEYDENIWVGRIEQSEALCQKILGDCRITIILGITGIGKTALAERVAEQTKQKWDQIARINFDDNKVSESFLEAASSMLSQFGISPTTEDYKKTDGLLELLVYNVQSRQVLLIIDSLEFILGENTQGEQTLKDATWQDFFKRLLTANRCNGRIILTSQILPSVLEQIASRYTQYFSKSVMSGLNDLEQLELFAKACLDISENSESCTYLRRMGAIYEGHPLSLRTIIGEIQELCFGNVLAYWEQYSEEFEMVERDIINANGCSISEDKWKINRLSLSMENKVQYRLQQTFLRLKNFCYLPYCLLCEASIFRGMRLEKQWINQFKERGDLSQELSDYEIREALNKLYAWYLVESEVQNNKRYIRLHNLVRSVALEHLNDLP